MCCTSAPAHLSSTVLLASETMLCGQLVHVLGYQNTVLNLAAEPAPSGSGGDLSWDAILRRSTPTHPAIPTGNAMILPFPAMPGSMMRDNVVSTEGCPKFLEEMAGLVQPKRKPSRGGARSFGRSVEVFDHGIYTVVLASEAKAIPDALKIVSPEKRPKIGTDFFDAYDRLYAGWTIALCCFSNTEAKRASPLLWWYRPMYPEILFAPALDAHDGRPPNVKAMVEVDHTVIFGSHLARAGIDVYFKEEPAPAVRRLLPPRVVGGSWLDTLPNGDFVARVEDIRRGGQAHEVVDRLPPPGAAS